MFEKLLEDTSFWSGSGQLSDTVMSTRVRFVRNQADIPFGLEQSDADSERIISPVTDFIAYQHGGVTFKKIEIGALDMLDRRFLRERNIIAEDAEQGEPVSLVYNQDSRFSMIIHASDHYRLQVMRSGLAVYECYGEIVDADEDLNRHVPYAFSEKYGYLTSSIDNTGTGMKVSVLMHLPVLAIMGTIPEVERMVSEIGGTMEPVTRTHTKNYGSFYLVSNSAAIGKSESELLEIVDDAARMVAGLETESRDDYYMNFAHRLEDRIWRGYGILAHARSISYTEALEHISALRLGIILSVIKGITLREVNDLFVKVQPAHLAKKLGRSDHSAEGYDTIRADFLRSQLAQREVRSA